MQLGECTVGRLVSPVDEADYLWRRSTPVSDRSIVGPSASASSMDVICANTCKDRLLVDRGWIAALTTSTA